MGICHCRTAGGLQACSTSLLGRRCVGCVVPCNLIHLHPAVEAAVATTGRALESGASALLPFSDKLTAPVDGVASCACCMVPTALPVAHAAAAEPHDRLTPSHDQQPLHRQLPHLFPASQALLSAQDDPPLHHAPYIFIAIFPPPVLPLLKGSYSWTWWW